MSKVHIYEAGDTMRGISGDFVALEDYQELEAQLAGLRGLVAVHLGEFSNESEEALMKALEEEELSDE